MVALLDLGSNAARFLLASIRPGRGFTILEEGRVQTRLAGGRHGRLPEPAVSKTLRAVHTFLDPSRRRDGARVIVLATAAVRDADNAELLLEPLRRRYRLDLRILTGQEEAAPCARRHGFCVTTRRRQQRRGGSGWRCAVSSPGSFPRLGQRRHVPSPWPSVSERFAAVSEEPAYFRLGRRPACF
jgi:hypothetical protein